MTELNEGTAATREFYNREGWHERDGQLEDLNHFGTREDGPIRKALHRRRTERLIEIFRANGSELNFVELGCGGSPGLKLREVWSYYTGVDFSAQGLTVAATQLGDLPHRLVEADITKLPFDDGEFDAVYSSQALYHIATAEGQSAALAEAMRVLRPGGIAVFVLANPFPLLFPVRMAMRVIAATPLQRVANQIRRPGPLPYLPKRPRWYASKLRHHEAKVSIECFSLASTWFNQRVSEYKLPGKVLWKMLAWIEQRFPHSSARLGNYIIITAKKNG